MDLFLYLQCMIQYSCREPTSPGFFGTLHPFCYTPVHTPLHMSSFLVTKLFIHLVGAPEDPRRAHHTGFHVVVHHITHAAKLYPSQARHVYVPAPAPSPVVVTSRYPGGVAGRPRQAVHADACGPSAAVPTHHPAPGETWM